MHLSWVAADQHWLCGSCLLLQPLECALAAVGPTKLPSHLQAELLHLHSILWSGTPQDNGTQDATCCFSMQSNICLQGMRHSLLAETVHNRDTYTVLQTENVCTINTVQANLARQAQQNADAPVIA